MPRCWLGTLIVTVITILGGCPANITIDLPDGTGITIPLPGANTVVVEVFNDTDFEVVPRIEFDNDSNWFAAAFPSEELATGTLEPGDLSRYTIDCDELGVVFSDRAGQYEPGDDLPIGQADTTRTLRRENDYDCGDTIQFHFLGAGDTFGVVVSVNGVAVD